MLANEWIIIPLCCIYKIHLDLVNPISDVELGSDDEVNQVGNYVEKLMGKRNENGDDEDNENVDDKRYRLMDKKSSMRKDTD